MKKNLKLFLWTILTISMFCSCNKEKTDSGLVVENKDELNGYIFESEEGSLEFKFTAEGEWNIEFTEAGASDWISVLQKSGSAGEFINKILVEENESENNRTTEMVIYCGNSKESFTLTQVSDNALVLAEDEYSVSSEGGSISIKVLHSLDFTVDIDTDWISMSKTKNTIEENLRFEISANKNEKERVGHITFSLKNDAITQKVTITQDGLLNPDDMVEMPDELFRNFILENFDTDKDGKLSVAEAQKITCLEILEDDYGYNEVGGYMTSVEGIQYMTNLESLTLDCYNWDNYMNDNMGKLSSIDLSKNRKLKELVIMGAPLDGLDVSELTNLESLLCEQCDLESLDLSKNTELKKLRCGMANKLTELDLSSNRKLTYLCCGFDGSGRLYGHSDSSGYDLMRGNKLTALDVSMLSELVVLDCASNKITELDLSHNTKLEAVFCYANELTKLELGNNQAMEWLDCGSYFSMGFPTWLGNRLTSLDLSGLPNLNTIRCSSNDFGTLDFSSNKKLNQIFCESSNMSSIDVSELENLELLYLTANNITDIDLTNNSKLKEINLNGNQISGSLDLSGNSKLQSVDLGSNKLSNVNVTGCPKMGYLQLENNALQGEIDFSANLEMNYMSTEQNPDLKVIWLDISVDVNDDFYMYHKDDWTEYKYKGNPVEILPVTKEQCYGTFTVTAYDFMNDKDCEPFEIVLRDPAEKGTSFENHFSSYEAILVENMPTQEILSSTFGYDGYSAFPARYYAEGEGGICFASYVSYLNDQLETIQWDINGEKIGVQFFVATTRGMRILNEDIDQDGVDERAVMRCTEEGVFRFTDNHICLVAARADNGNTIMAWKNPVFTRKGVSTKAAKSSNAEITSGTDAKQELVIFGRNEHQNLF